MAGNRRLSRTAIRRVAQATSGQWSGTSYCGLCDRTLPEASFHTIGYRMRRSKVCGECVDRVESPITETDKEGARERAAARRRLQERVRYYRAINAPLPPDIAEAAGVDSGSTVGPGRVRTDTLNMNDALIDPVRHVEPNRRIEVVMKLLRNGPEKDIERVRKTHPKVLTAAELKRGEEERETPPRHE